MRVFILGFDAFDPVIVENLYNQGKLPHLGDWIDRGHYSRFQVSNPAQSEVSWTCIATGLNPGDHGMFDFVHRDPKTYAPYVSLLPTGSTLGGIQFVRPHNARTIFDIAAERGYPSTSVWWPAAFPARPESPVRTIPGLGTPDVQGRLGIGILYSSDPNIPEKQGKTPVRSLARLSGDRYIGRFEGPLGKSGADQHPATVDFSVTVLDDSELVLQTGSQRLTLRKGMWSPIIQIEYKLGFLVKIQALTRLIVTDVKPVLKLYSLPMQIHPLHTIWRYGTPASFIKDSWKSSGPFLTLGWPQDTTALEDGCISDEQFLYLCESIVDARLKLLLHLLSNFEEGLLASVFDTLDRVQHMFFSTHPELIENWYMRFDQIAGEVNAALNRPGFNPARFLIASDHGFSSFNYKVHLNRWLIDHGFMTVRPDQKGSGLKSVLWSQTQAYALGLNSLYLNRADREGEGVVLLSGAAEIEDHLISQLLDWRGPDGRPVIQHIYRRDEAFSGRYTELAPDLVLGYTPGYRGSAETGLGGWKELSVEPNRDHWSADHCFDPVSVPGVLFANSGLSNHPSPSYRDIPALAIGAMPDASGSAPPPKLGSEDQAKIEERLKSLGYL